MSDSQYRSLLKHIETTQKGVTEMQKSFKIFNDVALTAMEESMREICKQMSRNSDERLKKIEERLDKLEKLNAIKK
jgi:hypothetical protein